ncbi:MarR family winged helix-turn-helix transcriptional regulator [Pseudolysinimonas sp.]|uniref:MarR family winged helix-turn-helix transcriptional regulator n=1 Tax=Pseudolysinimonas sp. TaxID=2680009 RepID=UPI003F7DB8CF
MNDSDDVWALMFRILGRSRTATERLIRNTGLTGPQARTLGYIEAHEHEGITARQIAETFGTTPASVSSLIGGLERGGYLERTADPADARSKLLRVLPKGRGLTSGFDEVLDEFKRQMTAPLTSEDRATLVRLLTAVDDHLDTLENEKRNA